MHPNISNPDHLATLIVTDKLDPFDPSVPTWALRIYQAGRLAAYREVVERGVTRG